MKTDIRTQAEQQLAAYGYTLSPEREITKGVKALGVQVSYKRDRFVATSMRGGQHKLWRGPDLGDFVCEGSTRPRSVLRIVR